MYGKEKYSYILLRGKASYKVIVLYDLTSA